MNTTTIFCPDIECGSCVKLISRKLQNKGIEKFIIKKDSLDVMHDPVHIPINSILASIRELGFRADTFPFVHKTFSERFRDMIENRSKYEIEYTMLKYSFYTFLILVLGHVLSYLAFFRAEVGFLERYGWWLFYLDIAVISIAAAIWHLKSYKTNVTSMVGMMIGMTFGMQTGLMLGTIFGATNGTFLGGMVGMLFATFVGWYNGKCCGIMGILEGMMAGMMNGIMGAMVGVMFFADHILWFMPFFIAINLIIMWGLSYMLFEELIEDNKTIKKTPVPFTTLCSWCFIITTILTIIMIYGPKSGLAR